MWRPPHYLVPSVIAASSETGRSDVPAQSTLTTPCDQQHAPYRQFCSPSSLAHVAHILWARMQHRSPTNLSLLLVVTLITPSFRQISRRQDARGRVVGELEIFLQTFATMHKTTPFSWRVLLTIHNSTDHARTADVSASTASAFAGDTRVAITFGSAPLRAMCVRMRATCSLVFPSAYTTSGKPVRADRCVSILAKSCTSSYARLPRHCAVAAAGDTYRYAVRVSLH